MTLYNVFRPYYLLKSETHYPECVWWMNADQMQFIVIKVILKTKEYKAAVNKFQEL